MNFQGLEFDGVPTDPDNVSDDNESVSSLVDEDVDFSYVYALFHFPQMVDGQVTVDEGEKLTLLDDSNSYWWLVQNLRDNQMGYIPADNIESAFGKLARVNRRKNIKLCKPDPEHIVLSRIPTVPNAEARRVKFNDKLVTQVFINNTDSDDDEEEEDDYYDDYEDDEEEDEIEDEIEDDDRRVVPSQIEIDHDEAELDDDSGDYSYYYSSNAGNSGGYGSQDAPEAARASAPTANDPVQASGSMAGRRVSLAPNHMGQISGEHLDDSDLDLDDDEVSEIESRPVRSSIYSASDTVASAPTAAGVSLDIRPSSMADSMYSGHRDSSMYSHVGPSNPNYYPSNDASDDGDSLSGALNRMNASHESVEAGNYSVRIVHNDTFGSSEAVVTIFFDELFGEVLHRALVVFGLTQAMGESLAIYARIQQRELVALTADMQVASLFDSLRKQNSAWLPEYGSVNPNVCTLVLANRSAPRSQLLPESVNAEDDPYMSLETGSHNVLRTSISTSADEGTSSFGPSISQSEYVPTDPVAAQNPGGTANGSAKRATKLKALSASYSSREQAPNESGDEQPLVEASSSSAGDLSDSNSDADADAAATAGDLLPDSRKVVQGLLRNIQPPKSRPSDTAVNRAKRNTVQISARGSVVDNDYQVSRASSQTRSALLRSASTRDYVETDSGQHPADELRQPLATSSDVLMRTTPSEPVIANNLLTQGLGHSASTLRPSSDTFAGEGNTSDAADNDSQERSVTAEAEGEEPLSPTSSSDTASIHHNEADDRGLVAAGSTAAAAAVAGGAAASVFSSAVLHRSLKDSSSRDSVLSRASIVSNSTSILNANRLSIVSLTNDELSLDDWLVILRGWNDMHDISATTTSFYQSFLKDMQGLGVTAPIQQTAAAAAAQSDAYDYIQRHVTELQLANSDTQAAIDDILGVSQGVGRRLDSLECELDDIARVLVHAN